MAKSGAKVAAVIVTYNRLEKLKKAIASILEQDIDEVVVVNNKSTDSTADWLKDEAQKDSRLTILNLEANTGGAGGFYYGTKYATENTDVDWVLLYDDDAYPKEDLIANFKVKANSVDDEVGAFTCGVYTPDGKIADFNRPGINSINSLGGFLKYMFSKAGPYLTYEQLETGEGLHVDFSSFVGLFVKTEIIKESLAYPKKEFFIYCDDWLYTLKLSMLGYKNLYYSDLVFYHDSNTFVASYDDQLWKKYYAYRNALYFYKVAAGIFFPAVFAAKIIKWIFDVRLYKQKSKYFETMFRAIRDSFTIEQKQDPDLIIEDIVKSENLQKVYNN